MSFHMEAGISYSRVKTRIIATIGPASNSPKAIELLLRKGANLFRLNFSHGDLEEHAGAVRTIRSAGKRAGRPVGILADLQGPKIRTGKTMDDAAVTLRKGAMVTLSSGTGVCTNRHIFLSYPGLAREIGKGRNILINDGAIRLRVTGVDGKRRLLRCRVLNTGTFSSRKGVNFPDARLKIPSLTRKDRKDLAFILTQDIDFVALSFVRGPRDIQALKRVVKQAGKPVKCIAKIEKPEALDHLPAILDSCEGIMVARGDLGVETSPYRVPMLQKDFIDQANRHGKIVIVATQMLESMITQPMPTRAEAADVANAVLDGADALMLSGETAVGQYPAEAVETMARIARETEKSSYYPVGFVDLSLREKYPPDSICEAAEWASRDLGNVPVIVFTTTGDTAFYLAKIRNQSRIFAFSPNEHVVNMLSLAWNTMAFVAPYEKNIAVLERKTEDMLLAEKLIRKGDLVLILSGTIAAGGATNCLKVKRVGVN